MIVLSHNLISGPRSRARRAFSLVELCIVVAIMGILSAVVITNMSPGAVEQMNAVAHVIASDIAYAQNMAIAHNSKYQLTFSAANNLYYLEHSGTNSTLNNLPKNPFGPPSASATRRTTELQRLPHIGSPVRLAQVLKRPQSGAPSAVTTLEFGPMGETTRAETTEIWLTIGQASAARYLPLIVDPITGLVTHGDLTNTPPTVN